MKEGTIFLVVDIHSEWPVNQPSQLLSSIIEDSTVQVTALPIGSLLFEVLTPGEDTLYFTSQKIEFINATRMLLTFRWYDNVIEAWINEKALDSDRSMDTHKVLSKPYIADETLSFNSSDSAAAAAAACREWMAWRKDRYSHPKLNAKTGRRIKSIDEQIDELKKALEILAELTQQIRAGKKSYIISVLPILRSLLFWPDKSGPYNPLLIRVAGLLQLPLPIYALSTKTNFEQPDTTPKPYFDIINDIPQLIKRSPNLSLMDFQEWLHSVALTNKGVPYRVKDLIFDAANTMSTAHFDDDIPEAIDLLNINKSFNVDLLTIFMLSVSDTAVDLGNYLLSSRNNSSIIQ